MFIQFFQTNLFLREQLHKLTALCIFFGAGANSGNVDTAFLIYNGPSSSTSIATEHFWRIYKNEIYGQGTGRYRITINRQQMSISASNGSTLTYTHPLDVYQMTNTLRLFPVSTSSRIYSCKIYDDGVLVLDMIPVRDTSNIPCMYDKVQGRFYYNGGTGEFIAGPVLQ